MTPDSLRAEIDREIEVLRADLVTVEDSGDHTDQALLIRRQIRDRQFERDIIPKQDRADR